MSLSFIWNEAVSVMVVGITVGAVLGGALLWCLWRYAGVIMTWLKAEIFTLRSLFWGVNLVCMTYSAFNGGYLFTLYEPTGVAVPLVMDLLIIVFTQAMLSAKAHGDDGRSRRILVFIFLCTLISTAGNLTHTLHTNVATGTTGVWFAVLVPYVASSMPLFLVLLASTADLATHVSLEKLDPDKFALAQQKRLRQIQTQIAAREVEAKLRARMKYVADMEKKLRRSSVKIGPLWVVESRIDFGEMDALPQVDIDAILPLKSGQNASHAADHIPDNFAPHTSPNPSQNDDEMPAHFDPISPRNVGANESQIETQIADHFAPNSVPNSPRNADHFAPNRSPISGVNVPRNEGTFETEMPAHFAPISAPNTSRNVPRNTGEMPAHFGGKLDRIDQRIYDHITHDSALMNEVMVLAQTMDIPQLVAFLQRRFPAYSWLISEPRIARIWAHMQREMPAQHGHIWTTISGEKEPEMLAEMDPNMEPNTDPEQAIISSSFAPEFAPEMETILSGEMDTKYAPISAEMVVEMTDEMTAKYAPISDEYDGIFSAKYDGNSGPITGPISEPISDEYADEKDDDRQVISQQTQVSSASLSSARRGPYAITKEAAAEMKNCHVRDIDAAIRSGIVVEYAKDSTKVLVSSLARYEPPRRGKRGRK